MITRYRLDEAQCQNLEVSSRREWVLANGIGGFAMGTVSGINTRRYHGFLIGATKPPTGRMLLVAGVDGSAQAGTTKLSLSSNQYPGTVHPDGYSFIRQFEHTDHVRWLYRLGTVAVSKTLTITQGENTTALIYKNEGKVNIELNLNPLVCHRDFHSNFTERSTYPQSIEFDEASTIIEEDGVRTFIFHDKAKRFPVHGWYYRFEHFRESERGLDPRDDLYCPCELRYTLAPGEEAVLVFSTQPNPNPVVKIDPNAPVETKIGIHSLREGAAKFLIETEARTSILAGYPWFTDWGRDTMISIPGICLCTGRVDVARSILSDYATQMFQGLIPNRFVEKGEKADYNTVDATLWFANAIYKTLLAEWDESFAKSMMTTLDAAFEWHTKGTLFGIKVDPKDGLLMQGEPGLQLTWMDAKIGDWVVTPRHGKPVEINGLWINLLRICEWLSTKLGQDGSKYATAAELAESNFEAKFWHKNRGHYLDTADPNDASLRPNQLIAMAVPFSPVKAENAAQALVVIRRELLTPVGMRTLGPNEPGYRGKFRGPMVELDSAYHQGTVWPWLLGPFITAFVKFTGDKAEAKRILKETKGMLEEYGLAGIAECYDGDAPHEPNACPWQAWSVGEILRAWTEDLGGE